MVPRPAIFDSHVLALDISFLFQPQRERAQTGRVHLRRCTAEEADYGHSALLCARDEWPRRCRADETHEFAALHVRPSGESILAAKTSTLIGAETDIAAHMSCGEDSIPGGQGGDLAALIKKVRIESKTNRPDTSYD